MSWKWIWINIHWIISPRPLSQTWFTWHKACMNNYTCLNLTTVQLKAPLKSRHGYVITYRNSFTYPIVIQLIYVGNTDSKSNDPKGNNNLQYTDTVTQNIHCGPCICTQQLCNFVDPQIFRNDRHYSVWLSWHWELKKQVLILEFLLKLAIAYPNDYKKVFALSSQWFPSQRTSNVDTICHHRPVSS